MVLILQVLGLGPLYRLNLGIARTQPSLSFTLTNHILCIAFGSKATIDKLSTSKIWDVKDF